MPASCRKQQPDYTTGDIPATDNLTPTSDGATTQPATMAGQLDLVGELVRALSNMNTKDQFKAPVFNGEGNVELFITQFQAVQRANGWTDGQALLHICSCLEGPALTCGKADTIGEVLDTLRARYGLTSRQAKERLSHVKKNPGATLHEYAAEVDHLVEAAFSGLQPADRTKMSLDYFIRSLGNRALQCHMSAIAPMNLREGSRRLHASQWQRDSRSVALVVEQESAGATAIRQGWAAISALLQQQSDLLAKLVEQLAKQRSTEGKSKPPLTCYTCGGPHIQRFCPQRKSQQLSGNETGPAQ